MTLFHICSEFLYLIARCLIGLESLFFSQDSLNIRYNQTSLASCFKYFYAFSANFREIQKLFVQKICHNTTVTRGVCYEDILCGVMSYVFDIRSLKHTPNL